MQLKAVEVSRGAISPLFERKKMEEFAKAVNEYFDNIDKEILRKVENNEKLNEYENVYIYYLMRWKKKAKGV